MWNKRVKPRLNLISSMNMTMKAWPVDPLGLRSLNLEVSEKLPQG
jgi:hypothetical protein